MRRCRRVAARLLRASGEAVDAVPVGGRRANAVLSSLRTIGLGRSRTLKAAMIATPATSPTPNASSRQPVMRRYWTRNTPATPRNRNAAAAIPVPGSFASTGKGQVPRIPHPQKIRSALPGGPTACVRRNSRRASSARRPRDAARRPRRCRRSAPRAAVGAVSSRVRCVAPPAHAATFSTSGQQT